MPFNGSGTYTPPGADFPAVTLTVISSTKYNNVTNDIAAALTNCVTRDGQSPMTASLPMGGQSILNLAAGTAAAPSVRWNSADGIYSLGAGQLAFSSSGTLRMSVGTTGAWTIAAPTSALTALTISAFAAASCLALVPADSTAAISILKDQNTFTRGITATNASAGTSALVDLVLTNGSNSLQLVQYGTGHATLPSASAINSTGAGGLRFTTSSGIWLIDTTGRLSNTSNTQPGFRARRTGGDQTSGTVAIFNTEDFDRGSIYNNGTGVFTAGIAGLYAICVNMGLISLGASSSDLFTLTASTAGTLWAGQIQVAASLENATGIAVIAALAASETVSMNKSAAFNGSSIVLRNGTFSAYFLG
jgi:hypothetical protein